MSKAQLVIIHLRVAFFNLVEFAKEAFLYYRNPHFAKSDLHLKMKYLLKSPYKVSKEFSLINQKELYTYGETPLTTLDVIAKKAQILSTDTVFELGSGTGRGCLWLTSFVKCKTVGIDLVPKFIENAESLKMQDCTFIEGNFLEISLEKASVIYLAATSFDEGLLEQIKGQLPRGIKVITVSQKMKGLKQIGEFEGKFPWGKSKIFLATT